MSRAQQAILDFWFGDSAATDAEIAERQSGLWWGKSAQVDARIRRDFGPLVEAAARGQLNHWSSTEPGLLALLLLTDQFRRNLYRDQAEAYALDELARGLTRQCLQRGGDRQLRPVQRVFVYLPLEHSESLMDQDMSVRVFSALVDQVPADQRAAFENFLGFARAHRDVIARYGRFPHRNAALGRADTAAERVYLADPDAGF